MAKPGPIAPVIVPPSPRLAKKKGAKKQVEVEASALSQGIAAHPGQSMTGCSLLSCPSLVREVVPAVNVHALSGDFSLLPTLVSINHCFYHMGSPAAMCPLTSTIASFVCISLQCLPDLCIVGPGI